MARRSRSFGTGSTGASNGTPAEATLPLARVIRCSIALSPTRNARAICFTLKPETIRNANLSIRDHPPQGNNVGMPDMLIGADFLRAHRVLISMSQRRMYVSYLGGEVFRKRRIE